MQGNQHGIQIATGDSANFSETSFLLTSESSFLLTQTRIPHHRYPLAHIVMGFSLQALWQNELILRRNLGYSRLETARTTEGGAQPPGLTVERQARLLV